MIQVYFFVYALSWCDTTSSFFGLGKIRCFTALDKLLQMQVVKIPDATNENIACAVERFLSALYRRETSTERILDQLR